MKRPLLAQAMTNISLEDSIIIKPLVLTVQDEQNDQRPTFQKVDRKQARGLIAEDAEGLLKAEDDEQDAGDDEECDGGATVPRHWTPPKSMAMSRHASAATKRTIPVQSMRFILVIHRTLGSGSCSGSMKT